MLCLRLHLIQSILGRLASFCQYQDAVGKDSALAQAKLSPIFYKEDKS
jgi:hypothetical protein